MAAGELAAWCGESRGPLVALSDHLSVAVRQLALAALLQDRLAEDSPAAEDGVKLLDVLPAVAAAATKLVRAAVQFLRLRACVCVCVCVGGVVGAVQIARAREQTGLPLGDIQPLTARGCGGAREEPEQGFVSVSVSVWAMGVRWEEWGEGGYLGYRV